jgi:hypothetical protein
LIIRETFDVHSQSAIIESFAGDSPGGNLEGITDRFCSALISGSLNGISVLVLRFSFLEMASYNQNIDTFSIIACLMNPQFFSQLLAVFS